MSRVERFWELDVLRGIAVAGMVGLHVLVDFDFLNIPLAYNKQIWYFVQTITAGLFLLLAGISLSLGQARAIMAGKTRQTFVKKQLRRGAAVFGWGMVITVVTRLVLGEGYVVFGILHLIGFCIFFSYPLLTNAWPNLVIGLTLIGLGVYFGRLRLDVPWLVWLGFIPVGFHSVDYFPLLPWSGAVVLGIFLGQLGYGNYVRRFPLKDLSGRRWIRGVGWLGRHSLAVYLVHQPVLLMVLWVVRR